MARKFTVSLDLNKNELLNARLQNLSSDPSSPVAGQIYYNTQDNVTKFYDGTQWISGGSTKFGLLADRPAASKGGTLYVATDTYTLFLDNGTSWIQVSVNSQDLSDAIFDHASDTVTHGVSGNIVGTSDIQTLTNKTISDSLKFNNGGTDQTIYANGNDLTIHANNTLYLNTNNANIELQPDGYANVYGDRIVTETASQTLTNKTLTDATLGNNLNVNGYKIVNLDNPTLSTDAANKAYVDSQISGANLSFYGTANEVEVSKVGNDVTIGLPDDVTVTGEITAASGHITGNLQIDGNVNIEGTLNAINRTEVNIEDNTIVLNTNFTGTPTSNAGITVNRGDSSDVSVTWNETDDQWTLTNNGSNYHAIARKFATNIGDGAATSYTVTHNLGTKDVTVQIFENNADYNQIEADVQHTSTSVVTVKFAVAPSSNEYRVVVVG